MREALLPILDRLDTILRNTGNEPIDRLGSYIVGATIVRNDAEELFKTYPMLEEIAELGAELETLAGSDYAHEVLNEIQVKMSLFKQQLEEKRGK